jgi:DNA-binding MarR family transcriptional regulator
MSTQSKPTIPVIRERMLEITREITRLTRELAKLANLTKRRSPTRRAPRVKSAPITKALAYRVKVYARDNPGMHMRDIGRVFSIDQGRVSEILSGFRNGKASS